MPIRFVTYNICNRRNGGLELVLRRMYQANIDMVILQENKITNSVYTYGLSGYNVVAMYTPSRHRDRFAVFYWPAPHFVLDSDQ